MQSDEERWTEADGYAEGHRDDDEAIAADRGHVGPRLRLTRLTCDRCRDEDLVYLPQSDELLCLVCDF